MSNFNCESCEDRGWLHMGEPFEIQACAECQAENGAVDDSAARRKHKLDHPDCQWPDFDIHHSFMRQMHYFSTSVLPISIKHRAEEVIDMARKRLSFPKEWPAILYRLGEIVDKLEHEPSDVYAWKHLEHAIAHIVQAQWRMKNGKWTLAHAIGPDDGDRFDGDKWRVSPLDQDKQ